jgi:hypothetical protein
MPGFPTGSGRTDRGSPALKTPVAALVPIMMRSWKLEAREMRLLR